MRHHSSCSQRFALLLTSLLFTGASACGDAAGVEVGYPDATISDSGQEAANPNDASQDASGSDSGKDASGLDSSSDSGTSDSTTDATSDASGCNECIVDGQKECSGAGWRQCVKDQTSGCLKWSVVEVCASSMLCDPATVSCKEACGAFCDPFSVVLLPDTQYYTNKQTFNAQSTYRKQMQWVIDHNKTDNIKFVIHLGDITNNNYVEQWDIASKAHAMLDTAGVPYSVVPGNHDFLVNGSFERGGSHFDTYFGASRFTGKTWYGGSYGSSNTNNYTFFEAGQLKFMVLSLEYSPRKDVLCWAEDMLAKHPDRRAIIATHCYMNAKGDYSSGCPDPSYATLGATGGNVWQELASRHSNVFLVVSGHIDADAYRVNKGNNGNDVHQMVVDYQFEAACDKTNPADCSDACRAGTYTGNGWMKQLTFDPRKNRVHAEALTVESGNKAVFPGGKPVFFCSELYKNTDPNADGGNWYSKDPSAAEHQVDFSYNMTSMPSYARNDGGKFAFAARTVNSVSAGDQLAPKVAVSPTGAFVAVWEDDSSTSDGTGNHDIMARGFDAGGCAGFKDIVVNAAVAGHQRTPSMAMNGKGELVVVWADDQDKNGLYQIRGRGFLASGSQSLAQFVVKDSAKSQQQNPVIGMGPDGRFVVAWEEDAANSGKAQVFVRGFSANGAESFSARSVHSDVLGTRIKPSVAVDESGGFVVAWQDDTDENGSYQIHARGFDAGGNERFARLTVNTASKGQQRRPVVAASQAGGFVVVWEDDQDGDDKYQIWARAFSGTGVGKIADFMVHADAAGQHLNPSISMNTKGEFVIGWQADATSTGLYQIRARSFRVDGSQWMAEWLVNRIDAGQQRAPDFSLNASGKIVSIWEDDMDGNNAFQLVARGFDSP